MKKFLTLAFLILFTSLATAGDLTISWDPSPSPDAIGYKIYMGSLTGSTWEWQEVGDTNSTSFDYNAPEDNLYLFRVSAYDSFGQEAIRLMSGIFYNYHWKPLDRVTGVGVK